LSKEEIVIFDIDGTLADVSERVHHLQKSPKDWGSFFGGMGQDKAVTNIRIILCSGRNERHRKDTVEWLANHGVNYHELLLRKDGDKRSDVVVKRELAAHIDKSKVLFIVEDRSGVVEMWRKEGLLCLQCAPGEF
jgi:FMN phosphatase YigB (HAD superfamily)